MGNICCVEFRGLFRILDGIKAYMAFGGTVLGGRIQHPVYYEDVIGFWWSISKPKR